MNIFHKAGLALAMLGAATGASAQSYGDYRHDDGRRYEQRDGRYDRDHGGDRRQDWHHHQRCHTEYRHHHRVRVCR